MAQCVRAFAPQAEGLGFRIPAANLSRKTGNDSSTAKRSAIGVLGDDHFKRMARVTVYVAR